MRYKKEVNNVLENLQSQEYKQLNNNGIRDMQFKVMVHTFEIISRDDVYLRDAEISERPYIKSVKTVNGATIFAINPNKFLDQRLYTLSDFEQVFEWILEDLHIRKYQLGRVDIAVDTTIPFEQCFKINAYLSALWACYNNSKNNCKNIGDDCKKRSIYSYTRSKALAIYNKKLESNGLDPASTRIEFRYLRVRKDITVMELVHDICAVLAQLPDYFNELHEKKIALLQKQYQVEQSKGYESNSLNLPIFVNKWVYEIFSLPILKGLYQLNCNGNCKDWLYRFRKRGFNLTLYSQSDILLYLKLIRKGLKVYVSN